MTTVDDAYRYCRAIAHKHGANFSVGFRFLPRTKRRAVYAAYAFCRWADDIADEGARERAYEDLGAWQAELDACYGGKPSHPITVALADALRHFAIPKSAFVALIDGCRQDMFKTRYETFDELLQYCALVAWSISDISLAIYGHRTAAAFLRSPGGLAAGAASSVVLIWYVSRAMLRAKWNSIWRRQLHWREPADRCFFWKNEIIVLTVPERCCATAGVIVASVAARYGGAIQEC